jgi:hypothetical protein
LPKAIICPGIAPALSGTGSELPLAGRAPGIVAEILFYREAVKKIGAESPVFCVAKKAPKFLNCGRPSSENRFTFFRK